MKMRCHMCAGTIRFVRSGVVLCANCGWLWRPQHVPRCCDCGRARNVMPIPWGDECVLLCSPCRVALQQDGFLSTHPD